MTGYPTAEQMAELDAALDALAEGRSYRPTLDGLIRGWRELVEEVEAGYDSSVYEYFNDLHVRAMLQSVIDGAPGLRAWIESELAPLDARFRAATRPRDPDDFLDRVPRSPGPVLTSDLDDPGATTTLYPAHAVGGEELRELWVPADELEEFCAHIVGRIEVISTFPRGPA